MPLSWLTRVHVFAFLPLAVAVTYFLAPNMVPVVTAILLPLLVALSELMRAWHPPGPSVPATPSGDPLTGFVSKEQFLNALDAYLAPRGPRRRDVAVLHVDVDGFNLVNKRFGWEAGDRLLREFGDRIRDCVRENDLVARIDRDDFTILLAPERQIDVAVALAVAERITAAMCDPFVLEGSNCHITCSIGVGLSVRAPRRKADAVLECATIALDLARRDGPGATRSFSPLVARETRRNRNLSAALDAALDNGQIRPFFQPQVCADSGEIAGFEALARWIHPEEGVLLPARFLEVIETAGRSERLSEVVLYHTLTALRAWDREGLRVPSVGVNFSSSELHNPRLVEKIKWDVDRFDILPARITIEVLETVVCDHEEDIISRNIRGLAAQGFGIDLDDFGTGHAAIANIRRFAVNRIKIDRSFITHLDRDPEQQMIASAIIRMAESLGLECLAEGVETVGERRLLAELGCRYVQGFGIARPMPFEETIPWLVRYREKLARGAGPARKTG